MPDSGFASTPRAPSFGHGNDTLASVLVVLNLLAFDLHTGCELTETHWQQACACSGIVARDHLISGKGDSGRNLL